MLSSGVHACANTLLFCVSIVVKLPSPPGREESCVFRRATREGEGGGVRFDPLADHLVQ